MMPNQSELPYHRHAKLQGQACPPVSGGAILVQQLLALYVYASSSLC